MMAMRSVGPSNSRRATMIPEASGAINADKQRNGASHSTFISETNRILTSRDACRPSLGVLFALLQRISKITVTGALHDRLRTGQLHVGTKAFCHGKIRAACQHES